MCKLDCVIWIITLQWHTDKTKLQANVLGCTPVFFTDTFDTARFTTPCLSTRCPPTRFVPMYNVLYFDWLMQQEMQIQKFQMNYTLQMTSQRKLDMGKEIRDKQQQFLIVWGILVCRIILPRTKVRVKLLNALGFLPNSVYL